MPNRNDIIAEARTWLGVPWEHQGRTKLGIDCAGVVVNVGRTLGLSDHDEFGYTRRSHGYNFLRPFQEHMDQKPIIDMMPGDALIFRDGSYPCHVAILAVKDGTTTIIHAHASRNKVLEEPISQGDWMSRRVACFAYRGLD